MRPCSIICCGLAVIVLSDQCTPAHSFGGNQDKEKTTPKSAWLIMADGYVKNDGGAVASRVEIVDPVYKYIGDLKPGAAFKAPPTKFRVRYGHYDPWVGMESKELTFTPDYGFMEWYEKRKQRVQSIDAKYRTPHLFITVNCDDLPVVEIMTQEPEAVQQVGPDQTSPRLESSFKPRSFKIEGLNIKIGKETVFHIIPNFSGEKEQVDVPIKITVGEGPAQEVHVITYVFSKRGDEIGFGRLGNHTFEPKRLDESKILSVLHGDTDKGGAVIQIQAIWLVIGVCTLSMLLGVAGFLVSRTSRAPAEKPPGSAGVDEIAAVAPTPEIPPADKTAPAAVLIPMEMPPPIESAAATPVPVQKGQAETSKASPPPVSEERAVALGEKIRVAAKTILEHFKKHAKDAAKHKNLIDAAKRFSELPDDTWLLVNEKGVSNIQAGRPLLMHAGKLTKTASKRPEVKARRGSKVEKT